MRIDRRNLIASALAAPAFIGATSARAAEDTPWMLMSGGGSGPLGRWGHSLLIDTWNNRLLVVGGRDEAGIVQGDLWSFDIGSYVWSSLDLSGPNARSGSAAAIAADGSGFYYFGGESDDAFFDDLWWFDCATTAWERVEPSAGARPGARAGTKGDIDALGRFVISHGRDADQLFDDTWAYDPVTHSWTDISPDPTLRPMARYDHDLVSLPDYGLLLLTGGCSDGIGPCPQGDLWAYDVYGQTWSDITPFAGPTPRTGAALSRLGSTLLLVGGETDLGREADVWEGIFDGAAVGWTELTQVNHGPLGIYRRYLHDMSAAGNEYYVFGGNGVEGALGDLWKFSFARYTRSEHSIQPTDDFDE